MSAAVTIVDEGLGDTMPADFAAAWSAWRRLYHQRVRIGATYAKARANALLTATGKTADAREAEAVLATVDLRLAFDTVEAEERAAYSVMRYYRGDREGSREDT